LDALMVIEPGAMGSLALDWIRYRPLASLPPVCETLAPSVSVTTASLIGAAVVESTTVPDTSGTTGAESGPNAVIDFVTGSALPATMLTCPDFCWPCPIVDVCAATKVTV
jgi:hypothetical protein